jgi:hypothetical protein
MSSIIYSRAAVRSSALSVLTTNKFGRSLRGGLRTIAAEPPHGEDRYVDLGLCTPGLVVAVRERTTTHRYPTCSRSIPALAASAGPVRGDAKPRKKPKGLVRVSRGNTVGHERPSLLRRHCMSTDHRVSCLAGDGRWLAVGLTLGSKFLTWSSHWERQAPDDRSFDRNEQHLAAVGHHPADIGYPRGALRSASACIC